MFEYMNNTLDDNIDLIYEDQNNHSYNKTGWICPKCGKAVSPEYKICPYCSTQLANEGIKPGEQMICS